MQIEATQDSLNLALPDSVVLTIQDTVAQVGSLATRSPADSLYIEFLERTNQQMSLWWNPYGVMVAVLGILFAVLAIVGAVILYRQSSEHRKLIEKSIKRYENVLKTMMQEKAQELKEVVSEHLEEAREKLKAAEGDKETQQQLEKRITALEGKERALESAATGSTTFSIEPANPYTIQVVGSEAAFDWSNVSVSDFTFVCSCGDVFTRKLNPGGFVSCPTCGKAHYPPGG